MPIGVVSGLPRETACLALDGNLPIDLLTFAGVGPERAAEGARRLLADGASALVSFGVAGGLADTAMAGALVVAEAVVDGRRRFETDGDWRRGLLRRLADVGPVSSAPIAGVDAMVATAAAKVALSVKLGAVACDMESHAVARVADEAGVPFVVLRAISDPYTHDVPRWVLRCLTPEGHVRYGRLAGALARRPWAVPKLMALGRDSKKAFDTLRRVARLAGPGLGFQGLSL